MIKVTSKTLIVNFETEVKLGKNDAIELTILHQAYICKNEKDQISCDIDLCVDVENIKFLGMEIESGYKQFNQFKDQLLALGINLNNLIDEKVKELRNDSYNLEKNLIIMFHDKC